MSTGSPEQKEQPPTKNEDGNAEKNKTARYGMIGVIVAAAIAAIAAISAAMISKSQPSSSTSAAPSSTSVPQTTSVSTGTPPSTTVATTSSDAGRHTFPETAGNRKGSLTFRDNKGSASGRGSIPYNTTVQVECYAENLSDMASINVFYKISGGTWDSLYAPANTFMNGDAPGTAGTHDIDPVVPPCR
ncbi:hypothetical protein [Actinocrispum sp. NPDC049592]|uniref:hypothetical protein n=1 Tax=Actinocrispum sp. NPDC049592 TaxID=3154835 RepID=UPI003434544A